MSWRDELATNPRLRIGLAATVATLGVYGLLDWHDHQEALAEQARGLAGQVSRLSSRQSMSQWPQRAEDADQVLQVARQQLWQQRSVGLAQAELQDWLRDQLRRTSAQNAIVRVAESETSAGARSPAAADAGNASVNAGRDAAQRLTRVSAQVEFSNGDPRVMLAMLATLARPQKTVVVDSVNIKPQRVEMRVSAWFDIAPEAPATQGQR